MLFPDFYILTCSNGTDKCVSRIASENSINIFLGFFAAIAILGLFFNSICVYVFYFTPSMNSRFITSLKIYSINSLLISLSDFINSLFFLICNRIIWVYNDTLYFTMPEHIFYYTYIYIPIWTILYTIGSSLDIFIVYGRIQVLCPKLKFLGKICAYKISVLIIVLSILINLPPNLGRQLDKLTLNLEKNQTLFLSKYGNTLTHIILDFFRFLFVVKFCEKKHSLHIGPSSYTNDYNFKQLVVASNSIRDFGIVLVEVGMNIVLFVMLRSYNARMVEITMSYQEKARNNNKLKNITIAIVLCFLSIVHHAVVFVVRG